MKVAIGLNERYYDGDLVKNLDALKTAVKRDWDGLLFVFGREGVGKSTFAMQLASYLDPDFSLDRVSWTPEGFVEKVMNAPKYACIVLDEAYLTFVNRTSIGNLQRTIISMLTMIRSRNLYIIVVSPTIFDMSKYLVVHRSLAAFRCYHHGLERGYWEMYGDSAKLDLYVKGRRDNNLKVAKADLRGRFTKWFPLEKDEYEQGKQEAVRELQDKMKTKTTTKEDLERVERESIGRVVAYLSDHKLLKPRALQRLSNYLGVDRATLYRWRASKQGGAS